MFNNFKKIFGLVALLSICLTGTAAYIPNGGFPSTTNLFRGNGTGGVVDSGIPASSVLTPNVGQFNVSGTNLNVGPGITNASQPYNDTNALTWLKRQGVNDALSIDWAVGFQNEIIKRGRALNDALIFPARWNPNGTNLSYFGNPYTNNGAVQTSFGIKLFNNVDGTTNANVFLRFPCSVGTNFTIAVTFRQPGTAMESSQNSSYHSLVWSLKNTNNNDDLTYENPEGFCSFWGQIVPFAAGNPIGTYYGQYTNSASILNDNGWSPAGQSGVINILPLLRHTYTLTTDGLNHYMAGYDGNIAGWSGSYKQLVFTNAGISAITTTNGYNLLNLALDNASILALGNFASQIEVESVLLFNGGYDTNMLADSYAIASWLFDGDTAVCIEGDSIMDNSAIDGTIVQGTSQSSKSQFIYYYYYGNSGNWTAAGKEVLPINNANGGSGFTTISNIAFNNGSTISMKHDNLFLLPKSKFLNRKVITDLGRNQVMANAGGWVAPSNTFSYFTNYYTECVTNGWDVIFRQTMRFGSSAAGFQLSNNFNLVEYNARVADWPLLAYSSPEWRYCNDSLMNIISIDNVHPANPTNNVVYQQAAVNLMNKIPWPVEHPFFQTNYGISTAVAVSGTMNYTNYYAPLMQFNLLSTSHSGIGINNRTVATPQTGGSFMLRWGDVLNITNPAGASATWVQITQ
jgi:hypothetical protein